MTVGVFVSAASALAFAGALGGEAETSTQSANEPVLGSADKPLLRRVPVIGRTPAYRPPPAGRVARSGRPVGGLRCSAARRPRVGVHLEVFANEIDMVIPAGIGVAPPRARSGAYVTGGRCSYPLRTLEPTGLIEAERGRRFTLGQFFSVWGQPLSPRRLVGFRARNRSRVRVYVNGRRWHGDPRRVRLAPHAAVVLEVGGYFPPTPRYVFPPGL